MLELRKQKVAVLDPQGEIVETDGEISENSMGSAIVMANNRISWLFLFANWSKSKDRVEAEAHNTLAVGVEICVHNSDGDSLVAGHIW